MAQCKQRGDNYKTVAEEASRWSANGQEIELLAAIKESAGHNDLQYLNEFLALNKFWEV